MRFSSIDGVSLSVITFMALTHLWWNHMWRAELPLNPNSLRVGSSVVSPFIHLSLVRAVNVFNDGI